MSKTCECSWGAAGSFSLRCAGQGTQRGLLPLLSPHSFATRSATLHRFAVLGAGWQVREARKLAKRLQGSLSLPASSVAFQPCGLTSAGHAASVPFPPSPHCWPHNARSPAPLRPARPRLPDAHAAKQRVERLVSAHLLQFDPRRLAPAPACLRRSRTHHQRIFADIMVRCTNFFSRVETVCLSTAR